MDDNQYYKIKKDIEAVTKYKDGLGNVSTEDSEKIVKKYGKENIADYYKIAVERENILKDAEQLLYGLQPWGATSVKYMDERAREYKIEFDQNIAKKNELEKLSYILLVEAFVKKHSLDDKTEEQIAKMYKEQYQNHYIMNLKDSDPEKVKKTTIEALQDTLKKMESGELSLDKGEKIKYYADFVREKRMEQKIYENLATNYSQTDISMQPNLEKFYRKSLEKAEKDKQSGILLGEEGIAKIEAYKHILNDIETGVIQKDQALYQKEAVENENNKRKEFDDFVKMPEQSKSPTTSQINNSNSTSERIKSVMDLVKKAEEASNRADVGYKDLPDPKMKLSLK